jgi:N-acetylated-alpha-linked acidic dipeptidase
LPAFTHWRDADAEADVFAALQPDEMVRLLDRFAHLVRESGTAAEREAAAYIAERLTAFGVPHAVHRPTLFISRPRAASLRVRAGDGAWRALRAKTPAMAAATRGEVVAPLAYVPTGHVTSSASLFDTAEVHADLRGRIAVTEGLPMPAKVKQLTDNGALAAVFVQPGEAIHEGICTTIWGAPDLDNWREQPTLPVLSVNRPDGEALIAALQRGEALTGAVAAELEGGWESCPVVVAEIRGRQDPDRFVLLHGHYDSWHVGIGDNATGDALLLELARVLGSRPGLLRRSLRIAWWPGHSTGRYAGSTWYADRFGLDLEANAVAQVNCDSPGCRWATEYRELACMAALWPLTAAAVRDVAGPDAVVTRERPNRAGDYSFNNLGVPATLMLSSTMPEAVARAHGYYPVGGCGGNIAWHTEDDLLPIADVDLLLRDARVYAAVVLRLCNAPLHPIDLGAELDDAGAALARYRQAAPDLDLAAVDAAAAALRRSWAAWCARAESGGDAERLNAALRRASRLLVRSNYARRDPWHQDPALEVPPLPDLEPALRLGRLAADSHEAHVTRTHLQRGANRVAALWGEAARALDAAGA